MDDKSYKLKKIIKELSSLRGRHTELISIYVPQKYPLNEIGTLIANEISLTQNVKSKAVRKNVTGALSKIQQHLKRYKKTPPNGLAIFCGNVSENEGGTDIKIWPIEPPDPIKVKLYWCDQKFELKHLEEMVEEKDVYGLIVLDNGEATVGLLKGKAIKVIRHINSLVPGKTAKGGQSAARFGRVREGLKNDFYKKVAATARAAFENKQLKGILLGGPGPVKETFHQNEYMQTDLRNMILGTRSIGYADEGGLKELVEKSMDLMEEAAIKKEKELLQKFFTELKKGSGKVTYGMISVLKAIKLGAVEMILVNEECEWEEVEFTCSCGYSQKEFVRIKDKNSKKCPDCGATLKLIGELDVLEALDEFAKEYGSEVEVISTDTPEGSQLEALGGVGAILRYKI
jgi:peptide chain release factor subunit 1